MHMHTGMQTSVFHLCTCSGDDYERGLALQYSITILGIKITITTEIDLVWFKSTKSIAKFKFGGLELGGLGCDMKKGTKDDGVCLVIELGVKLFETPGKIVTKSSFRAKFAFTVC